MTTKITTGGATVVASGSVFSYEDKPIEITLLDVESPGLTYTLKFSFAYDTENSTSRWIFGKDHSNVCFHMELINFNNPIGTGILSPFSVASNKQGISYYITFMVNSWEQKYSKLFSYTIYRVVRAKENGEK